MSLKSRANLAIACGAALSVPMAAISQTLPPQQYTSAYTTSPEAAGITSGSSTPPALPIGELVERNHGSLLRAETSNQTDDGIPLTTRSASYYDVPEPKPKLLKKHDLVTIVIRENSQFLSNGTTDFNRTSDLNALIDSYVTLGLMNGFPTLNSHTPGTPIQAQGSAERDFTGAGQVQRQDSFTGRITAEVLDVKPNGTLILEATEEIRTDDESQRVTLMGTCRVDDITADNTVLSNQLYDLSLSKQHKGAVKDAMKRGLIGKILDFICPF
jgi:flagellar L-ring protein FlgH